MESKLIIGIDPGTTTAIAMLDLNGNIICVESRKNFSVSAVSKFILENGEPVVISTDIQQIPKFIEKVAANFCAKTIIPEESVERRWKNALVKKYLKEMKKEYKPTNKHEKDALAAAIMAFKKIRPLFNRIEQEAGRGNADESIKSDVLLKRKNIKSVLMERNKISR
jgi:predicted RNase H-like nuclease (RuvC/YqgF family)